MPSGELSLARMLTRGLTGRCPRCGSYRHFVRRGITRLDRCRTCGIRWHREEGFELGALTMNMIVTFIGITVALVVGMIRRGDRGAVWPILVVCSGIAVVAPMLLYAWSHTTWLAIDLATNPPTAEELAAADAAVGGSAVDDA
jgi:uncharacterized protein (DUF983 family)